MEGALLPIAVAHGEGRAEFVNEAARARLCNAGLVRRDGSTTTASRRALSGEPQRLPRHHRPDDPDGRVTIMMPHPERVFRTVQNSWHPEGWGEDGGWMRMFRNARAWMD